MMADLMYVAGYRKKSLMDTLGTFMFLMLSSFTSTPVFSPAEVRSWLME